MPQVSQFRLHLLRAFYLLIAVGLGLSIWPQILFPVSTVADSHSTIRAILAAFSLLALLGLRYPLQMLPILIFELMWKTFWVLVSALPMWLNGGLDEYANAVFFACAMGIVLTPMVIPWKYVYQHYVKAAGAPWWQPR
jgi:hypothetical protein